MSYSRERPSGRGRGIGNGSSQGHPRRCFDASGWFTLSAALTRPVLRLTRAAVVSETGSDRRAAQPPVFSSAAGWLATSGCTLATCRFAAFLSAAAGVAAAGGIGSSAVFALPGIGGHGSAGFAAATGAGEDAGGGRATAAGAGVTAVIGVFGGDAGRFGGGAFIGAPTCVRQVAVPSAQPHRRACQSLSTDRQASPAVRPPPSCGR